METVNYLINSINPLALKKPTQDLPLHIKQKDSIHIEIGSSNWLIDTFRNLASIPLKIVLFNSNIQSGNISPEILEKMRDFLHENQLHDVLVSVNQYKPQQVWSRTFSNPNT